MQYCIHSGEFLSKVGSTYSDYRRDTCPALSAQAQRRNLPRVEENGRIMDNGPWGVEKGRDLRMMMMMMHNGCF